MTQLSHCCWPSAETLFLDCHPLGDHEQGHPVRSRYVPDWAESGLLIETDGTARGWCCSWRGPLNRSYCVISFYAPAQAFSWPPGVECEIFNSSSVMSAGTSAKSGVLR